MVVASARESSGLASGTAADVVLFGRPSAATDAHEIVVAEVPADMASVLSIASGMLAAPLREGATEERPSRLEAAGVDLKRLGRAAFRRMN